MCCFIAFASAQSNSLENEILVEERFFTATTTTATPASTTTLSTTTATTGKARPIPKTHHIWRIARIHSNLFSKWEGFMGRCKNGDKFNSIHARFSADDFTDSDVAKSIWDVRMKYSFDICDLPVTRKYM